MFQDNIIKYIKYLTYLLMVLVPLVYFPTMMFPFQLSKTVVFQILAEIIFALWLGLAIFDERFRPKLTSLTIVLSVFMFVVSLSVLFGPDWRMGLWSDESRSLGAIALWHFFALYLVVSSLKNEIDWGKLWFLSFGTAIAVSLIGISQKFIALPRGANAWLYIIYSGIPERIGATFSNSSFLAGYLLFNFFIGLYLFASRKTRINTDENADKRGYTNWFLSAGTILILIAIFLSQTLGVILGLGVGIFFLLIYFAFFKFKEVQPPTERLNLQRLSLSLLFFCIIFTGAFWLTRANSFWQKIPGLKRIADVSLQDESISGRLITWSISWKAFKEKPVFGWGFENFRIPFNKYYEPKLLTTNTTGTYWDKPHNILLEYLINTGIFGLLAYLGIFGAAFYTLFKFKVVQPPNIAVKLTAPFLMAILIAYFFQNIFVFDTIGTYLMFFFVLAFIDSNFKEVRPPKIDENNIRRSNLQILTIIFLLLSLTPIYYNYQIFNASRYEYWGVNYFLNQLKESSLVSFSQAVKISTPYIDDIRKNFANTVKQAYQQGIEYSSLGELQGKLADHLRLVIKRHPKEFFNYIVLAEFENVFYKYNPNYPKEAEELSLKALELSPKRQQIYYVLAKAKLLQGDIQGAYKAFEYVINLNPDAAEPHFYLGLMAYGLGDVKKGAMEIAEAERLGRLPGKTEELVVLGNLVGDFEHNYKKAVEYYLLALRSLNDRIVNPVVVRGDILLKLAVAYYFDNNYDKSRETFLELKETIDLKSLPMYPDLEPVLQELNVSY